MCKTIVLCGIMFLFFSCQTAKKSGEMKKTAGNQPVPLTVYDFIPDLSDVLVENSGLLIYKNLCWGFNDSGGKNELYAFGKSGKIKMQVEIKNAENHDWESIAQDKSFIYVGDFGNNNGNRKNLCIYKIDKKDISKKSKQKVKADKIEISYARQKQFSFLKKTTPYDCEAMAYFSKKLYLFSKNWKDYTTKIYELPTKDGEYKLQPTDSFDVKMLVTGADISPDKRKMALIGYKNYQAFMWIFSDFPGDHFFKGKQQYFSLPNVGKAQTEGICFFDSF